MTKVKITTKRNIDLRVVQKKPKGQPSPTYTTEPKSKKETLSPHDESSILSEKTGQLTFLAGLILLITAVGWYVYWSEISASKKVTVHGVSDEKAEELPIEETIDPMKLAEESIENWQTHIDEGYGLSLRYPDNWFSKEETDPNSFRNVTLNGDTVELRETFLFSNYQNMDEYTPQNKPEDMRLLALIIYQKEGYSIDKLAKALGFTEERNISESDLEFSDASIPAREFVSISATRGEPRIAIFLQRDDLFFVFNLGFTGNDQKVITQMERIVSTIEFKD